jgi:hypothetical protein
MFVFCIEIGIICYIDVIAIDYNAVVRVDLIRKIRCLKSLHEDQLGRTCGVGYYGLINVQDGHRTRVDVLKNFGNVYVGRESS